MNPKLLLLLLPVVSIHAQEDRCAGCHPRQTAAFARTAMGRSLSIEIPRMGANFTHAASGSRLAVGPNGTHSLERSGLRAAYSPAFAIGSGDHAQGYAVQIGERLFQSPIAAYRGRQDWNVAPGYEGMAAPDFNRPVTTECLLCHSGGKGQARSPIDCERCHGDAEAHLRQPSRQTIVNPARLAAAERDSVCEQCHLNGEARVANPGKSFGDFRPGQRLEDTFSVFVFDAAQAGLKVVSHAEQLARSTCRQLWCGTCHQPHGEPIPVSQRCSACHSSLSARHPAAKASCESCHMPKRPAQDGAHVPFTDHRIQRPAATVAAAGAAGLRAWREPADSKLAKRNLGLAYVMAGERDGSEAFLNRGYEALAAVFPNYSGDADVLSSLGMVLYLKDKRADGAKLLRAAISARPGDSALREKLAVVLKADGQRAAAMQELEKAIALDPSRETAYHLLAEMQPDVAKRRAVVERYLRFNPQSLIAREAIARLPAR